MGLLVRSRRQISLALRLSGCTRGRVQAPRGDWVMRVRFWGENTREHEKWVKLALGHFLFSAGSASARLSPQSPVAWPNHRAWILFVDGLGV